LFNLYTDRIVIDSGSNWQLFTLINRESLALYLPYWNALWIAAIAQHAVLLAKREWTIETRIFSIALSALNVAMAAFMLNGPSLLDTHSILALQNTASPDGLATLAVLLQKLYRAGLIIAVVATTVETVVKTFKLIKATLQKTMVNV
jgi:hypothetical protein